ncbi:MAG: type II/IV secretion system protein [Patescibacteria group bacterium]
MHFAFNEQKQNEQIDELKKLEAENLTKILSAKYGLPYLDLTLYPVNIDALRVIKEEEARAANVAPFNVIDKQVRLGILSPKNPETIDIINGLKNRNYEPVLFLVSMEGLKKVWERYKDLSYSFETKGGALTISNEEIAEFAKKVHGIGDIASLIKEILGTKKIYRISRLFEIIIAGALSTGASDIHFEPEETHARLRYRLDGILTDIIGLDPGTYGLLLSRIKLLSNLKLNIKGRAQDGRFTIMVNDSEIEIRTSLLPGAYNDTIVLRILNPDAISVPLEELGIHPRLLKIIEHEISKPNGMILNTGPTGSGKTTTLYAFLKKIHSPEIKIITIENPIEYHLPGIVQTQTDADKGYTFLEGLRSALRQDPDVIMVGEIRDNETAEIAINAALTGHLVFSTLHTNNAAGTFPRLIDLGVNPKVITSSVSIAMAQRLVRKLCSDCKREIATPTADKKIIDSVLATIADKTYFDGIRTEKIWLAAGCAKCHNTGYKGRIGIFEAIKSDANIEEVVENNPSEREVKKAAASQNILDMTQDGVIKVLLGITTMDELNRVVDMPVS